MFPSMRLSLLSLAVLLVFAGCGYKGPLYLPKPKPGVAQNPATSVTPATSVEPVTPLPSGAPGIPGTPGIEPLGSTPAAPQEDDATR